ncbi:MAG TPA: hypothetical protein VFI45_03890 [Candidatus Acidoferrum sp.]|nr:hypothetical protein [Candidatus Acidoferrum sp.]
MKFRSPGKWLLVGLAGPALILLSPAAFPQSCALCYTQAASSGSRMIEALRSGILVLIIPPTLMWLVIAAIMYSKRNQFKRADNPSGPGTHW